MERIGTDRKQRKTKGKRTKKFKKRGNKNQTSRCRRNPDTRYERKERSCKGKESRRRVGEGEKIEGRREGKAGRRGGCGVIAPFIIVKRASTIGGCSGCAVVGIITVHHILHRAGGLQEVQKRQKWARRKVETAWERACMRQVHVYMHMYMYTEHSRDLMHADVRVLPSIRQEAPGDQRWEGKERGREAAESEGGGEREGRGQER